jgi:hypothetical protein
MSDTEKVSSTANGQQEFDFDPDTLRANTARSATNASVSTATNSTSR